MFKFMGLDKIVEMPNTGNLTNNLYGNIQNIQSYIFSASSSSPSQQQPPPLTQTPPHPASILTPSSHRNVTGFSDDSDYTSDTNTGRGGGAGGGGFTATSRHNRHGAGRGVSKKGENDENQAQHSTASPIRPSSAAYVNPISTARRRQLPPPPVMVGAGSRLPSSQQRAAPVDNNSNNNSGNIHSFLQASYPSKVLNYSI